MATNPTVGYVVVGLDYTATYNDFLANLSRAIGAAEHNLPKVYIELDTVNTQKSFDQLNTIIANAIQNAQTQMSSFSGAVLINKDYTQELQNLSTALTNIGQQIDQIIQLWNNGGRGRGGGNNNTNNPLIAGTIEYERRLLSVSALIKNLQREQAVFSGAGLNADPAVNAMYQNLETALADAMNLRSSLESGAETIRSFDLGITEIRVNATDTTAALRQMGTAASAAINSDDAGFEKKIAQIQSLRSKIDDILRKNTAASGTTDYANLRSYRDALEQLETNMRNGLITVEQYRTEMTRLSASVTESANNIRRGGLGFRSFGDTIRDIPAALRSTIGQMLSAARIAREIISVSKELVKSAIEMQNSLADLKIVTGATSDELERYAAGVSKTAQSIGASTSDIITATTTYARLGYTLDESDVLAKYTAMLQKVGDVDSSTAQDAITAILAAFPSDANIDTIESVMDRLVSVGNNFPISVTQIAEAMNNASSSLAAAGNTFDESVALLAAANTTIQNASKTSTGLRTITARLRNTKTDLDELGETDFTQSKYDEMVQALTKYGVKLIDVNGEYRSTYEIMHDIAEVWKDLSSMEQAALETAIAGTRQGAVFQSLITNFDKAADAIKTMDESTGSLESAYSVYLDTISAHIESFKASVSGLGYAVVSPVAGIANTIIDLGTSVISVVTTIVNAFSPMVDIVSSGAKWLFEAISPIINFFTGASGSEAVGTITSMLVAIRALSSVIAGTAGPIGIFIGVIATLSAARDIINNIVEDLKPETLDDVVSEFESAQQEVDTLTKKLEENAKAIRALQDVASKGSLTVEQQEELSQLQTENDLLKTQLELRKSIADIKAKEVETKAKGEIQNVFDPKAGISKSVLETANTYAAATLEYRRISNDYYALLEENNGKETRASKKLKASMEAYQRLINISEKNLNDSIEYLATRRKILAENERENSNEIAQIDSLINAISERLNNAIAPSDSSSNNVVKFASRILELSDAYKSLAEEQESASKVILQSGYAETVSLEAYDKLISASKDYAIALEYENGTVRLNADTVKELYETKVELQLAEVEYQKILAADAYKKNLDEIKSLEIAYSSLTDEQKLHLKELYDDNAEIGKSISTYDILIAQLNDLTGAYQNWVNAQKEVESGAFYDSAKTALKQIQDGLESGKVGTAKYKASVELLIPEEYQNGVAKYAEDYLDRYLTDDITGVQNFLKDSIAAGLMSDDGASITVTPDVNLADFAEKLHITPDLAKYIFGELEEYDFNFEWDNEDFGIGIDLSNDEAITKEIQSYQAKIDELLRDTSKSTEDKMNSIARYESLIEQLSAQRGEVEETDDKLALTQLKLESLKDGIIDLAEKQLGDFGASETTIPMLNNIMEKLKSIQEYRLSDKSFSIITPSSIKANAKGTKNFTGGVTLLGDEYSSDGSPKPELVVDKGEAFVAGSDGPEIASLSKGAVVYNNKETEEILNKKQISGKFPAFAKGSLPGNTAVVSAVNSLTNVIDKTKSAVNAVKTFVSGGGSSSILTQSSASSSGSGGGGGGGSSSSSSSSEKVESWFEKQMQEHKHLVQMDKETQEDYLKWLEQAYQHAYSEGIIDLKDYYKYMEEVYDGMHDLFKDHLGDLEFQIDMLEEQGDAADQIVNIYNQLISDVNAAIINGYAQGLNDNSDYIQELKKQLLKYQKEVEKVNKEVTEDSKDNLEKLIQYRIKMIKKDIEEEKKAYNEKLSSLKDYIDQQKKLLQDASDAEDYFDQQSELQQSVANIEAAIEQLRLDDSAWAQKKRLELQADLANAQKELADFEKDHALQAAQNALDEVYNSAEIEINKQIDLLDEKLNDAEYLYQRALYDIQHNTMELFEEMLSYEKKFGDGTGDTLIGIWEEAYVALKKYADLYGTLYKGIDLINATGYTSPSISGYAVGTRNATPGLHRLFENGDEYIFSSSDGNSYKMFSGGEKVISSAGTDFLYSFAENGRSIISNLIKSIAGGSLANINGRNAMPTITMGNIIINGSASEKTVSEIRRAQRENVEYMLKELSRLK